MTNLKQHQNSSYIIIFFVCCSALITFLLLFLGRSRRILENKKYQSEKVSLNQDIKRHENDKNRLMHQLAEMKSSRALLQSKENAKALSFVEEMVKHPKIRNKWTDEDWSLVAATVNAIDNQILVDLKTTKDLSLREIEYCQLFIIGLPISTLSKVYSIRETSVSHVKTACKNKILKYRSSDKPVEWFYLFDEKRGRKLLSK